jgi:heavy metal sensor kinase
VSSVSQWQTPTWSTNRLPEWMRSIRFRYTLLYSGVLFGLAALVIGAIYLILWISLHEPMSIINGRVIDRFSGQSFPVDIVTARQFERLVHQQTLDRLRTFSFEALIVLFFASLVVGWVVAGRVLAPIGRITGVAREIQATDLSRRIRLQGPNDELKQLADTFDAMLARIDAAFAAQQQFLADASHELRNPLAIIRTNADLALSDNDPQVDELRQAVVVVKRASDRMARLVDDLLALARRESPTFAIEQVDLGRAVTEASEEFLAPAEARGIVLDRAVAPGVVVMGDGDALKRAVANLLENAVRLAPAGSRIRLAVGSERGLAWIAVSDEGPGIAPENQPRVFDRFWRADKGRSRADGGTGLGLSIVRQIAQSHGGDVQLQSKLGVGSTFTIWLPVANVSNDPAPRITSAAPR